MVKLEISRNHLESLDGLCAVTIRVENKNVLQLPSIVYHGFKCLLTLWHFGPNHSSLHWKRKTRRVKCFEKANKNLQLDINQTINK
jgi:hypothetical protein